ncbi:hypothetical protein AVEN_231143-1 [Araneus ventricosus]|uniref:Pre-C2HC domain-containing protein n=1 Tax=Araneus ventricosus TaxID=182803 RepID=A0A4Y2KXW5_ARAVE|nr:hypothetical protein AVEN_231143-1 [Araneus ventricosus]
MQRLNEVQKISCAAKPKGEFMHVFCNSSLNHRKITDYLDTERIQYYVVPPAAKKPVKVVIKGLPIDFSTEEIKNNLTKLNFRVDKVNQLRKFKDKKPLNIFQVHLLKSENIQDIYKLTTMEYYFIYAEKYERKAIGQCFCCQKFALHSSGCKMEARCVICAETHDSRACPMKKRDNFTPKCTNCDGPHTASFRGCLKCQKLRKTVPGQSYASILKENNKNTTTERPPATNNKQKIPPTNLSPQIIQEILNPNYLSDLIKLLKETKKIMDSIPNIKKVLKKMESTENITTKLLSWLKPFRRTNPLL